MDSGELKVISGYDCRSVIIDSHDNGCDSFRELWINFKSIGPDGIIMDLDGPRELQLLLVATWLLTGVMMHLGLCLATVLTLGVLRCS